MAVRGFRMRVLKYKSTLPAAQRFTASRIMGVHRGLFVVSYNRKTRVRLHGSGLGFAQLGRVFVSRLRNSRYFKLVKLVSAFNVLKEATALCVRYRTRLRHLLAPRLSFFYGNVDCGIIFRAFSPNGTRVVCSSHSLAVRAVPLHRQVPAYKFLFSRGRAPTRVHHSVVGFCRVPMCRLGQVGGNTSCALPSKGVMPGGGLAVPSTLPHQCTCYSSAVCLPHVVRRVCKISLLFRRTAFTRDRRTHTGRAFRAATSRTKRVTHATGMGRLLVKRFSTHCRSRDVLLRRTSSVFPGALLTQRALGVSVRSVGPWRGPSVWFGGEGVGACGRGRVVTLLRSPTQRGRTFRYVIGRCDRRLC